MFSDMKPPILFVFWFFLYPTIDLFNSLVQYFIWNHRCFQLSLYFLNEIVRFFFFCNFAYGFYKNEIIDFSIVCVCYMKLFSACFCICAYETSDFLNLFYVFRMKELMFIYIFVFSYETHDSLISLCLCICNHRFVFFHLKTIDVRICCVCCPCETIDVVF